MYSLPSSIQTRIEELSEFLSLKGEYANVSSRYRAGGDKTLQGAKEHLAYLASRMPATYAVNIEVLQQLAKRHPFFCPQTVLDVGSGPATSLIALLEKYPELQTALLVERDQEFVRLAKQLLRDYTCDFAWQDVLPKSGSFDLVISSYMLSELPQDLLVSFLEKMADVCRSTMILIDTGTPLGYKRMMQARDFLLQQTYHLVAPCPHAKACPMDWCHFSVRLPRSHLHRQVKGVDRGFEDEKFCYLIASKESVVDCGQSRLVKPPLKRSGHVHLSLCTPDGTFEERIVSKKMDEAYKEAKKAEWGDLFRF